MIFRDEALELVRRFVKTENTVKHMLATEAIMRALATKLEPGQEDRWGLTGLLHDLDYEVMSDSSEHGLKIFEILDNEGIKLPEETVQAIKAHNYQRNAAKAPETKMDWSLFICDTLTGLIVATALVRPDKKLASVKVKSVLKKWNKKDFAAGVKRESIELCEEKLGIKLDDFIDICLKAMQVISDELGL